MGRKRDRTHFARPGPYSFPKRRRPVPSTTAVTDDSLPENNKNSSSSTTKQQPATVIVIGVPSECSVLDIKSRFEIYGSISRTRVEPNGLAHITFRSNDSAQNAVDAAVDNSFPITLHSKPVQVIWATDHASEWKEGVMRKDELSTSTVASKLVRAEVPLSRHGRGNRLGSAIVNPRDEDNDNAGGTVRAHVSTRLVEPYQAYNSEEVGSVDELHNRFSGSSLYKGDVGEYLFLSWLLACVIYNKENPAATVPI